MSTLKAPGLYLEKLRRLPVVVLQEETAVPAFIGVTETNVYEGKSLQEEPVRITSLADYEKYFGGPAEDPTIALLLDADAGYEYAGFVLDADIRYYLYNSMRLYFDNGGRDCYVVAVATYDEFESGSLTLSGLLPRMEDGLVALYKQQEVTLLVFPDAVNFTAEDLGTLQQAALAQAASLQNRFVIMDVKSKNSGFGLAQEDGSEAEGESADFVTNAEAFRTHIGTAYLNRGAAYGPYIQHHYPLNLHFRNLSFQDLDANTITPETLAASSDTNKLVSDLQTAIEDVDKIQAWIAGLISDLRAEIAAFIPTAQFDPEGDTAAEFMDSLSWYFKKIWSQYSAAPTLGLQIQGTIVFKSMLKLGAGYLSLLPEMVEGATAANQVQALALRNYTELIFPRGYDETAESFISFLLNSDLMGTFAAGSLAGYATGAGDLVLSDFDDLDWLSANPDLITADTTSYAGANSFITAHNAFSDYLTQYGMMATGVNRVVDYAAGREATAEQNLYENHPILGPAIDFLHREYALMPASGAVTGIYVATDYSRGVWRTPANFPIQSIKGVSYAVSQQEHEDLNVDVTAGKSINVIKAFPGRGILIFGGRTLEGNSAEWRYISVRRLFMYVEQSLRLVVEPLMFEGNDANAWVRIKIAATVLLTELWDKGALYGAAPQDAYIIKVGLGETMTQTDILEGRLIVEVSLAAARPAEFIKIKLTFLIQESIT